jgi:hypothetical protein
MSGHGGLQQTLELGLSFSHVMKYYSLLISFKPFKDVKISLAHKLYNTGSDPVVFQAPSS